MPGWNHHWISLVFHLLQVLSWNKLILKMLSVLRSDCNARSDWFCIIRQVKVWKSAQGATSVSHSMRPESRSAWKISNLENPRCGNKIRSKLLPCPEFSDNKVIKPIIVSRFRIFLIHLSSIFLLPSSSAKFAIVAFIWQHHSYFRVLRFE